jgi:hypothetical protein
LPINTEWHRQHRMPKNPTPQQRAAWHVEHAKFCACREKPESVRKQIEAANESSTPRKRAASPRKSARDRGKLRA